MEQTESLKTTADLEEEIKLYLNPVLNYEPRIFGYPVPEFAFLILVVLICAKIDTVLAIPAMLVVIVFKKKREMKPKDWFMYIPYATFKVPYGYLLPPGRRTFLP